MQFLYFGVYLEALRTPVLEWTMPRGYSPYSRLSLCRNLSLFMTRLSFRLKMTKTIGEGPNGVRLLILRDLNEKINLKKIKNE